MTLLPALGIHPLYIAFSSFLFCGNFIEKPLRKTNPLFEVNQSLPSQKRPSPRERGGDECMHIFQGDNFCQIGPKIQNMNSRPKSIRQKKMRVTYIFVPQESS